MLTSKIHCFLTKNLNIKFNYISKRALDEIQKSHGKSALQRALMYTTQAKLIAKEGFFSFKNDVEQYFKLIMIEKVDNKPLTPEQEKLKKKIAQDMGKLKPIILINILPFSAPLLIFYIITYPSKVPSYFCLDELYELHQIESIKKQKQAIEIFKNKPIDPSNFSLVTQTLDQLKLLSQLLFGHFEDGVVGINKYFKKNPKSYLLHPHFSKHLVIRKIKADLKKEVDQLKQLQNKSIEQLVLWKYNRIMSGQDHVVFKPVQHKPQELQNPPEEKQESDRKDTQISMQHNHSRHNPSHRTHLQTVQHERNHHPSSQTRQKK